MAEYVNGVTVLDQKDVVVSHRRRYEQDIRELSGGQLKRGKKTA